MTYTSHPEVHAATRLTERLLDKTGDAVRLANARAVQWLACLAAGTVAVPALWATRGTTPWAAGGPARTLATMGCVVAGLAAVVLILALLPRTRGSAEQQRVPVPRMVAELCWLNRVAATKSRYVTTGTVLTVIAGALLILAAL